MTTKDILKFMHNQEPKFIPLDIVRANDALIESMNKKIKKAKFETGLIDIENRRGFLTTAEKNILKKHVDKQIEEDHEMIISKVATASYKPFISRLG